MRMRWLTAALFLAVLGSPAVAQQGAPGMQRRIQLEQQLMQRFVQRAAGEMQLSPAARQRLGEIVRESFLERRRLNLEAVQLRRRMVVALQGTTTTNAQFEEMLQEQRRLRQREQELWERDQVRLRELLSPRQRAQFAMLWQRLQDDARSLMQQRGEPGAPPPPPEHD
jgi:hypothetical protein